MKCNSDELKTTEQPGQSDVGATVAPTVTTAAKPKVVNTTPKVKSTAATKKESNAHLTVIVHNQYLFQCGKVTRYLF